MNNLKLLEEKQSAVERSLMDSDDRTAWKDRPDHGGWWLWLETDESRTSLILIDNEGTHVASDDDWLQDVGIPPNDDLNENYWEGDETTQERMPGVWFPLANACLSHGDGSATPPPQKS